MSERHLIPEHWANDPAWPRPVPLDPSPQLIHESEEEHPETCGCSFCTPKQTERIPLDQWWNEPAQIARLYRWLKMRDRLPEDTADFIAHARSWERDYRDLVMWAGPA